MIAGLTLEFLLERTRAASPTRCRFSTRANKNKCLAARGAPRSFFPPGLSKLRPLRGHGTIRASRLTSVPAAVCMRPDLLSSYPSLGNCEQAGCLLHHVL